MIFATRDKLRENADNIENLATQWADADGVYRKAKAVAFLTVEGKTVAEKEARVDIECDIQRNEAHISKALWDAAKSRQEALQSEMSGYQTIAGLIRAEMGLAGRYES